MVMLLIGFALGIMSILSYSLLTKYFKSKKGQYYKDFKSVPLLIKLRDSLRHIIYEYDIKRSNEDFLLNILKDDSMVMQVMHRAHFPYLCTDKSDIAFGMALYLPVKNLSDLDIQKLGKLLEEEGTSNIHESQPFDYFVVDFGKNIRIGSYIITRVLKEIFHFEPEEKSFNLELFSEGQLPYFGEDFSYDLHKN